MAAQVLVEVAAAAAAAAVAVVVAAAVVAVVVVAAVVVVVAVVAAAVVEVAAVSVSVQSCRAEVIKILFNEFRKSMLTPIISIDFSLKQDVGCHIGVFHLDAHKIILQ